MKQASLVLLIMVCAACTVHGQDTIALTNGNNIIAKVLEVNLDNIRYKDYNNPDGPIITIRKAGVAAIRYPNGTQTAFGGGAYGGSMGVKDPRAHGWYFGVGLGLGISVVSSTDPSYSVGGSNHRSAVFFATKMLGRHWGLQFGLGADYFSYVMNFGGYSSSDERVWINSFTIPARVIYLSNTKRKTGFYAMAGLDASVVTSAKNSNSEDVSGYYKSSFIAPYLSAGVNIRTRHGASVLFAGPYLTFSSGNFYSGNYDANLGLSPDNHGSLSAFGLMVSCMGNFSRRR